MKLPSFFLMAYNIIVTCIVIQYRFDGISVRYHQRCLVCRCSQNTFVDLDGSSAGDH